MIAILADLLRAFRGDGWCCQTGLNCRPLHYQWSALPLSYGSMPGPEENRPERPDRARAVLATRAPLAQARGHCGNSPNWAETWSTVRLTDRSGPIRLPWRPKVPAAPRGVTSRPRLRSSDCPGVACPALSIWRVDTVGPVMVALNRNTVSRRLVAPSLVEDRRCMFFMHRPPCSIVVTWTHHDG